MKHFTRIPNEIIDRCAEFGVDALGVYVQLAKLQRAGKCWPGIAYLKKRLGIRPATVIAATRLLEGAGFIRIQKTRGKGNVYELAHFRQSASEVELEAISTAETHGVSEAETVMTVSRNSQTVSQTTERPVPPRKPNKTLEPRLNEQDNGASALQLPDWVPEESWQDFLEMRRELRKFPTIHAQDLLVRKLGQLRNEGHDPKAVLEQSIINSWQGLFELKDEDYR